MNTKPIMVKPLVVKESLTTEPNPQGQVRVPDGPRSHELKCWPEFFVHLMTREKTFEWRKFDRDFRIGDTIWIKEWDPDTKQYTGRSLFCRISYILSNGFGVPEGFCVLGLSFPPASTITKKDAW